MSDAENSDSECKLSKDLVLCIVVLTSTASAEVSFLYCRLQILEGEELEKSQSE